MIYLDYSATTPVSEKALEIFNTVSKEYFGNPQSLHDIGSNANRLLEVCRKELSSMIHGHPNGIYFTSGGTESNILAIRSLLKGSSPEKKHIITSKVEHSSILNTMEALANEGYHITYLPVNCDGEIELERLKKEIKPTTALVCLTHVNSEIGTIQPIKEIGAYLKMVDIPLHVDAVQSFGKVDVNVAEANVASLAISSHKIYGPKGVGACYVNPQIAWKPLLPNTNHEGGFRAGTVNVPGIAAFVTAAGEVIEAMPEEVKRYDLLRKLFIKTVADENKDIKIEEHPSKHKQLPTIIGLRLKGIEGQYVMLECNRQGIAISTGSACQVGLNTPSKTMLALGRSKEEANEFIRISLGRETTEEQIKKVAIVLSDIYDAYYKK
ncbi:cysteine desulfurase [Lottiidibacillus patelloidae]|uniref:Cysteine desulfurase n=1 Tax=Lottiidibacillus patelloidae TaxID=2670334 RepID=A0A263BWD1_9BACI|nr:IscS subfamily cysteine desulfurase [Lottiidibacillus patelloidae]OZM58014.1 cysteine desulfurase [Lottiidibacillus patelloidae]